MPRFYCHISEATRRANGAYRWRIQWYESTVGGKIPGTDAVYGSGTFRKGKRTTVDSVNCFSHKAKTRPWASPGGKNRGRRGSGSFVRVVPEIGEVWGIFKIKEETKGGIGEKKEEKGEKGESGSKMEYDLVLITKSLESTEESGEIRYLYLDKVPGFVNVFQVKSQLLFTSHFIIFPP